MAGATEVQGEGCDMILNGIVNTIDRNASDDDLEKLRLLAAAVLPFEVVEDRSKRTYELYKAVLKECESEPNAVAMFKRLLKGAGYARRFVEQLTPFTVGSQPSSDLNKLYFYELLVEVANEIGNLDDFRYLKNSIPQSMLDINRDNIKTCIQLFLIMEQKRILDPSNVVSTLTRLEGWLKGIHRNDVAEIVRKRIDEVRGEFLLFIQYGVLELKIINIYGNSSCRIHVYFGVYLAKMALSDLSLAVILGQHYALIVTNCCVLYNCYQLLCIIQLLPTVVYCTIVTNCCVFYNLYPYMFIIQKENILHKVKYSLKVRMMFTV